MTKSALQIARAAYQPKLPKALKGTVKAAEGAATQSVADQEEIKKLFPNTYGMPLIKFETTDEVVNFPAMNVGVILSGGQADHHGRQHDQNAIEAIAPLQLLDQGRGFGFTFIQFHGLTS